MHQTVFDLASINSKIRKMQKTAQELNQLGDQFPSLARNTARIMASLKMLELNLTDAFEMGLIE